eukprot:scaffold114735_cov34-Tisochrysis_lutea.AAC.5
MKRYVETRRLPGWEASWPKPSRTTLTEPPRAYIHIPPLSRNICMGNPQTSTRQRFALARD